MAHGHAEKSESSEATSQQCQPAYQMLDGDPIVTECDLDPMFRHVPQGPRC